MFLELKFLQGLLQMILLLLQFFDDLTEHITVVTNLTKQACA